MSISSILQCFLVDEEFAHKNGLSQGKNRPAILESYFEGIRAAPEPGQDEKK
jgi:hypothetical protein